MFAKILQILPEIDKLYAMSFPKGHFHLIFPLSQTKGGLKWGVSIINHLTLNSTSEHSPSSCSKGANGGCDKTGSKWGLNGGGM